MLSAHTEFLTTEGWVKNPLHYSVLCWREGKTFWRQCDKIRLDRADLITIKATNNLLYSGTADTVVPVYNPTLKSGLSYKEDTIGSIKEKLEANQFGYGGKHICTVHGPNNSTPTESSDFYMPLIGAALYGRYHLGRFYLPQTLKRILEHPTVLDLKYEKYSKEYSFTLYGAEGFNMLLKMQPHHSQWALDSIKGFNQLHPESRSIGIRAANPDWLQVAIMFSGQSVTRSEDGILIHKKLGLTPIRRSVEVREHVGRAVSCALPFAVTRLAGKVCVLGVQ